MYNFQAASVNHIRLRDVEKDLRLNWASLVYKIIY